MTSEGGESSASSAYRPTMALRVRATFGGRSPRVQPPHEPRRVANEQRQHGHPSRHRTPSHEEESLKAYFVEAQNPPAVRKTCVLRDGCGRQRGQSVRCRTYCETAQTLALVGSSSAVVFSVRRAFEANAESSRNRSLRTSKQFPRWFTLPGFNGGGPHCRQALS